MAGYYNTDLSGGGRLYITFMCINETIGAYGCGSEAQYLHSITMAPLPSSNPTSTPVTLHSFSLQNFIPNINGSFKYVILLSLESNRNPIFLHYIRVLTLSVIKIYIK